MLASMHQVVTDLKFALGRRNGRRRRDMTVPPRVTLLFSAYNEERVIAAKMTNCEQLDYPTERLEVLVGCDGCSDSTAALARNARLGHARVLDYTGRSGK